MQQDFLCSVCGEKHAGLPLSYGADAPYYYDVIATEERAQRAEISSDQCVIDDEHFFVRGCVEIQILETKELFVWGVWVSLSEENFCRVQDLWLSPERISEPPYFGWLSTSLPCYPETLSLKTHVHTRAVGERPLIEIEPTEHPLSLEQRNGITLNRVREIAETIFHSE